MGARSIQISLPSQLLERVDRYRKSKKRGRSAIIQEALQVYLLLDKKRSVDAAYERAYGGGKGDALFEELADLAKGQTWPE